MLSKYARVTSLGHKSFSSLFSNQTKAKTIKWVPIAQGQSFRLMSKSIADEILKAKEEQQKQQKGQASEEGQGGDKKEYKPLTKWQKIGFWFAGIGIPVYLVAMAVLFCKLHKRSSRPKMID